MQKASQHKLSAADRQCGFVSEAEAETMKQERQDEWERVRKPEDPIAVPEEPVDSRSLYDKLQEQKDIKEMEWQEEHAFKNNTFNKALEEDEAEFLDAVDTARCNAERERFLAEKKELEDFQKTQQELKERELEQRMKAERNIPMVRKVPFAPRTSQLKLLAGAVKRKSNPVEDATEKKKKVEDKIKSPEKAKGDGGGGGKLAATMEAKMATKGVAKEAPKAVAKEVARSDSVTSGGLLSLGDYGSDSEDSD